jgi:hypothetical protein
VTHDVRRSWARRAAGLGLFLVGASVLQGAAAQTPAPPASGQTSQNAFTPGAESPDDLPQAPGREETFYACTACHNFKLVAAQGMTRAQWDDSLTWMTTRHNMAEIQGADRDLILDYLEKHYPPRAPSRAGGWKNPFAPQ